MQHPNLDYAQKLIDSLMGEHRLSECHLEGVRFDSYTSSYGIVISQEGKMLKINVPSELLDRVQNGTDTFARWKIKSILKNALGKT